MVKLVSLILKFFAWLLISPIFAIVEVIKYLVKGKSLIGKFFILVVITGFVSVFIFKPFVFKIIIAIGSVIDGLFAFLMIKAGSKSYDESTNYNGKNIKSSIPFFEGMTTEEAKKEYRKLMKTYHPDNDGGSLEMTQKVAEAYSKYCAVFGR